MNIARLADWNVGISVTPGISRQDQPTRKPSCALLTLLVLSRWGGLPTYDTSMYLVFVLHEVILYCTRYACMATAVPGYMAFVAIAYDMHIVAFLPDLTRAQHVQTSKGVYDHERGIAWMITSSTAAVTGAATANRAKENAHAKAPVSGRLGRFRDLVAQERERKIVDQDGSAVSGRVGRILDPYTLGRKRQILDEQGGRAVSGSLDRCRLQSSLQKRKIFVEHDGRVLRRRIPYGGRGGGGGCLLYTSPSPRD